MTRRVYGRGVEQPGGFTLVEVTIAVTLLGLMMMILYAAFYLGQGAVEKSRLQSEASQSVRSLPQFLGSYIRSAYPYRSPGAPSFFFSGEEKQLSFVSAFSAGMGGRGFARVTLSWNEEENGLLSLAEEIPLRLENSEGGGHKNRVVLGKGVRDFRLSYLALEGADERWVERWEGKEQKTLPRAVRLRYRPESGEEVDWVFPVMMKVLTP